MVRICNDGGVVEAGRFFVGEGRRATSSWTPLCARPAKENQPAPCGNGLITMSATVALRPGEAAAHMFPQAQPPHEFLRLASIDRSASVGRGLLTDHEAFLLDGAPTFEEHPVEHRDVDIMEVVDGRLRGGRTS